MIANRFTVLKVADRQRLLIGAFKITVVPGADITLYIFTEIAAPQAKPTKTAYCAAPKAVLCRVSPVAGAPQAFG